MPPPGPGRESNRTCLEFGGVFGASIHKNNVDNVIAYVSLTLYLKKRIQFTSSILPRYFCLHTSYLPPTHTGTLDQISFHSIHPSTGLET